VKLYHSFLSNLIAERKVEMIVATVDSWIQKGDFDRSFVTLVMREDDSLTLNLLHLVIELPDDILDGLHLAQNGKFSEWSFLFDVSAVSSYPDILEHLVHIS